MCVNIFLQTRSVSRLPALLLIPAETILQPSITEIDGSLVLLILGHSENFRELAVFIVC